MPDYLLLESGSHLLPEDGSGALLLESSSAAGVAVVRTIDARTLFVLFAALPAIGQGHGPTWFTAEVAAPDPLDWAVAEIDA